jgi:hypothetical protein
VSDRSAQRQEYREAEAGKSETDKREIKRGKRDIEIYKKTR